MHFMHAIFSYTTDQWLLFFFIYCFFGWIFESTYVVLCKHRLCQPRLHEGAVPAVCTGSGAILMLFVSIPVENHLALVYLAGCIAPRRWNMSPACAWKSCSRCVTGTTARSLTIRGRSACHPPWPGGGLTIFLLKVIHPPIERFVLGLPTQLVSAVTHVLTALVGVDMARFPFKAARMSGMCWVKLTALKGDLDNLQNRANVIVAFAQADMLEKKGRTENGWKSV